MKYILKKEYPGSPKLGTVIERDSNCSNYYYRLIEGVSNTFTPKNIENQPEFWQPVVEKDYEILEYKTESGISCKAPFLSDSHQFYIDERCKIYSIKRISDNSIFTIGDDVLSKTCGVPNKILSIEIINNKIRLCPRNSFYNLEDIKKVKQKLFTTEDGINIFEGDNVNWVCDNYEYFNTINIDKTHCNLINGYSKGIYKIFSTKEKAEEYILMNKPVLSLNDIKNCRIKNSKLISRIKLKELVKQKLNK